MSEAFATSNDKTYNLQDELIWEAIYPSLKRFALGLVRSYWVPLWRGQEAEIVEDVVQTTAQRLIEYAQKAERQEVEPINSYEGLMKVIARHYCQDLMRHDRHLGRLCWYETNNDASDERGSLREGALSASEIAIENVYQKQLFLRAAHRIITFPLKQRRALLIDLAQRMSFETTPTPLQEAFLLEGIDLHEYQNLRPTADKERARHSALLSLAYKRLFLLEKPLFEENGHPLEISLYSSN